LIKIFNYKLLIKPKPATQNRLLACAGNKRPMTALTAMQPAYAEEAIAAAMHGSPCMHRKHILLLGISI
jgi:hypothetical protein